MHEITRQYYNANAEPLATQYRTADVAALHALFRRWLPPRGRFVCSFCSGRTSSAEGPRLYADREPCEVRLLFERLGFTFVAKEENADGLGRGTRWVTLVFDYDHQPGSRPVDQIESIINHDKKDATHFHGQNGLSRFHGEFQGGRLDPTARKLVDAALNKIANTVVVGPVTFASQGGFAFGGGPQSARNRCHTRRRYTRRLRRPRDL
ncbi:MAG TPA: hypothetical protein PLW27_03045 [Kiritimatiellia bacterium]|jgi:hypothetical protein|nr:hypothetical protein [Kiritimatiellia bacterium]MDD4442146.1 hypothetical protein [Kiritimatiellia bacterium]OQC27990.1 MAG: hypothetical protein BWX70_02012 [Verrucomicrobia bacterium ADurb.Bin070]HQA37855.1 hypothetical protein [Kiritimatiellia bacterium]